MMKRYKIIEKTACIILSVAFIFATIIPLSRVNAASGTWHSSASGWWFEYSGGGYASNSWVEISGYWYYFTASGYMDYSEYRDGCWLNSDGTWDTSYSGGHWASDSKGWWYTDTSGWYPVNQWVWIDGSCYYFKANGYMATNEYIDGCYVESDGAWNPNHNDATADAKDWKSAYLKVLDDSRLEYDENMEAILEDLNGDGIPEMLLDKNTFPFSQDFEVYTFREGETLHYSTVIPLGETELDFYYNGRYLLKIDRGQDVGSYEEFDIYKCTQNDFVLTDKYIISECYTNSSSGIKYNSWKLDLNKSYPAISEADLSEKVDINDVLQKYGYSLRVEKLETKELLCRYYVYEANDVKKLEYIYNYDNIKKVINQY